MKYLGLLILMCSTAFADQQAVLTIKQTVDIHESTYDYFIEEVILSNSKCSIDFKSNTPLRLNANEQITGTVSVANKTIRKDMDSIGRQGITSIAFTSDKKDLRISLACFTSGMVFPTLGLPDVAELRMLAAPYLLFSQPK